ncbi:MAG: hypothetical protein A2161_08115 [Candidatus Schekmanbacteria bacterium RBG_13_48_7]|uniref:Outer membrane lipoprotein BamD-like domain-containing protein n=1 Tax=Candidatus Schekmanbacteria bacterium RBG_13_48_7 TaxID=1817878 RepID=A0A1F7RHP7_9BACT|nr:MAG: hypothetical protein A2161_08115 [Candidatus Schekmanbacteria bacterium RBG_13_48_7]
MTDWVNAEETFQALLDESDLSENQLLRFSYAQSLFYQEKYDLAATSYFQSLKNGEENENSLITRFYLAKSLMHLGELSVAQGYYDDFLIRAGKLSKYSENISHLVQLAQIETADLTVAAKKYETAFKQYSDVLNEVTGPDHAWIEAQMKYCRIKMKIEPETAVDLEKINNSAMLEDKWHQVVASNLILMQQYPDYFRGGTN